MGYLGIGAVLYLVLATAGTASIALFVLVTGVILSFYGGGFATVPAYLKDLFGTIEVGAVHGRLLTAWSAAGIAGALIVKASPTWRRATESRELISTRCRCSSWSASWSSASLPI